MIRVLIVDEYIMRQGLKYMIDWEKEGYQIVGEAANGKEALDLIDVTKPHIVISDIVMPMLDGLDFTEVIHKLYPSIQIIILSGYDNFEYVKKTFQNGVIDYILKPTLGKEELKRVLKNASEKLPDYQIEIEKRESFISPERGLERYLLGVDKELASGVLNDTNIYDYGCFYAMDIKKENKQGEDLTDVIYGKIDRFFSENDIYKSISCLLKEEIFCVLICFKHNDEKRLVDELIKLSEQIKLLCEEAFAVCSRSFRVSDVKKLRGVYISDVTENIDKGFYYEDTPMLLLRKESEHSEDGEKFDFFRYNQLLWGKQYKDALEMLLNYNDKALSDKQNSYRLKNQIENMIFHFIDSMEIQDEKKDKCRKDFFARIKNARFESDYREQIFQIKDELMQMTKDAYLQDDNRIAKMLDYIFENYQEDLKLEDLADEFNFNYHYISTYFNKHMKEGFSDYLNRVRIEKACKLLLESDMSIARISSEVGYSEHSYFCRVFKKIVGETPSAWRRNR